MSSKHTLLPFTIALCFLLFSNGNNSLNGEEENPKPIFCIGGGYLDGGSKYSGGVLQVEYKWGKYFWHRWRPQITLMIPELRSIFLGLGIGWECHLTKRITLIPSFSPGFYYQGSGRNLGFPVEFRSAIELSYQINDKSWVGLQASHISNAHLGNKNPGINAFVLTFAFSIE